MENLNKEVIEKGMNLALYKREKWLLKDYEDILTKDELFWRNFFKRNIARRRG